MIKNVGDVACIVFIGSPDGEQQFELAVPERTIEEELEQYKWYRVFRFVVYSVMALAALLALIVSIIRHGLRKVVLTLGKTGLVSAIVLCGLSLILVLILAIELEDFSTSFLGLSATQWLIVYGSSGIAILLGTIYVIKKTGFLEEFADKALFVKILSVCVSVFGLFAGGWALWEGLLKHVPSIIVSLLLLALALLLFYFTMGALPEVLRRETMTPREKLAQEIAEAITKIRDRD